MDIQNDRGKPAIVLGNGPSLKGLDFSCLSQFNVFGMNAAYRYWDEIGWYPQYYSCLDLVVGLSHKKEIKRLIETSDETGIRLFLLRDNLVKEIGPCKHQEKIVNFDDLRHSVHMFNLDPITTGSHTAAWASLLGYRSIFLLGIDCNYQEFVAGSQEREGIELEIVEEKTNPNYFFDGYQRKGDKYNIPNPQKDLHLRSWRQIAKAIENQSSTILNANDQSKVDAFEFCRFEDIRRQTLPNSTEQRSNTLQRITQRLTQFISFCFGMLGQRPFAFGGAILFGVFLPGLWGLTQIGQPIAGPLFAVAALSAFAIGNGLVFAFARSIYRSD